MHKKVTDFGAQPKPILFLHCAHLVLESCVILMLGEVDLRISGRSSGSWRNIFRSEIVSRASLSELNVLAASGHNMAASTTPVWIMLKKLG